MAAGAGLFGRLAFWCAAAIVAAPLLIYHLVFPVFIDDLTPVGDDLALAVPRFLWEAPLEPARGEGLASGVMPAPTLAAGAEDALAQKAGAAAAEPLDRDALLAGQLAAAYRLGLASAGLTLAAVAAALAAWVGVLAAMPRRVVALAVGLAAAGGYTGYAEQWSNPLRQVVADCRDFDPAAAMTCPLNRAAEAGAPGDVFSERTLENAQFLVSWSAVVGMIASGALAACFAALAFPWASGAAAPVKSNMAKPRKSDVAEPGELRRRRRGFFLTLGCAAVLLSFAVATTHAFYGWSATLIRPPAAERFEAIASTAANYWGFVFTVVLLVAAGLSAAALAAEIGRTADAEGFDTPQKRKEWLAAQDLNFEPARGLVALLLSIGPLLTSPLLDALKAALA